MRKGWKWVRIALLILSSLVTVAFSFGGFFAVLSFSVFLRDVGGLVAILGGIVGFALGAMCFWRFSLVLARMENE